MGIQNSDNREDRDDEAAGTGTADGDSAVLGEGEKLVVRVGGEAEVGDGGFSQGPARYVASAFFAVGIAAAYVFGHTVSAIWGKLASTQSIVDHVPWLMYSAEDTRSNWSMVIGGVIAAIVGVYAYRRRDIRTFVDEAASELAKVAWPNREEVVNGTIVVVVASFIAMIYLMLLDRFWGFMTDLVYRA
ncbi:MAG: preprotein translocase subunit SecE [Polyangiaceae bacterium]|nr:preprotein translocase subunit SecE [Polyangiaceae bacterium]